MTLARAKVSVQHVVLAMAMALSVVLLQASQAFAAPDPTTGVDYKADLADPILTAVKPAIIAGLAVLVLFAAVKGGIKMWSKVTGTGK